VRPHVPATTVVTLGDSITEGYMSTTDANHRYPDYLAARLGDHYAVANEGIGGNRVTGQVSATGGRSGVNVLARLDRDVLAQPNVKTVVYMEGINDIGTDTVTSASRLIQADEQVIARVHAAGLRIIGGTMLPIEGSFYYSPQREQIREQVNAWIRTSGAFDGVVDFDAAVADPGDPLRILPAYDSGDHLHPDDAGYQAMADAVPPSMLTK
jgi:lysophospholipase L1-like esterase